MPASFEEVFAADGIDEDARPFPGMILPVGGAKIARLARGKGLQLQAPRTLKVEELSPLLPAILAGIPMNAASWLIHDALGDDRYFRISGNAPIAPRRLQVKAVAPGSSKPQAVLDVAVLKMRKVKLSIRPVQIRDPQGALVFHSKKPFDIKEMVGQMNAIWTPQANVAFELVSSSPVQIVDEVEIAKILQLNASTGVPLPEMVVLERFADLFSTFKDKGADLTMFLVESVGDLANPNALYSRATVVAGATIPALGISLIGDDRTLLRELPAHEAGHFIGSHTGRNGKLMDFGHRGGKYDLMKNGGSIVARIPFNDVIRYFNPP
jgi:hypothetical protein